MKNILIIILVVFSIQQSHAQLEVSTNPIALLFEVIPLSASMPLTSDISVGLDILLVPREDIGIVYGKSRYYFNPKYGADRFNVGAFVGGGTASADSNFGLGFLAGYKLMSSRGVFIDFALGIGRGFGEGDLNALPYAQLHFGYRFGKKTVEDKIKK